jgi:hypothetical protein
VAEVDFRLLKSPLNECIGDLPLVEKAVTGQLAATIRKYSRFYVQVNNFRFARDPGAIQRKLV